MTSFICYGQLVSSLNRFYGCDHQATRRRCMHFLGLKYQRIEGLENAYIFQVPKITSINLQMMKSNWVKGLRYSKLLVWRGMNLILMIFRYLMVFFRVQYWVLFCFVFIFMNLYTPSQLKTWCYIGACSPYRTRNMRNICDEFGERYSLRPIFIAIKFKCLLRLSSNIGYHVVCLMPQHLCIL